VSSRPGGPQEAVEAKSPDHSGRLREWPDRLSAIGLPVIAGAGVIALWWLAVIGFGIEPFMLPDPPAVVRSFTRLPGYLLDQSWATLSATMLGYGLAVLVGLITAVLLTASRTVERAVLPLLVAANAVPKVAVAPLLVLWLGFGATPKILMAGLISVFPIVVAAMAGLTSAPVELTELARSLSASRWQTYRKLRFPWALPQIFIGLKLGVTLAVVGAVVSEIGGGDRGLGYVIFASGASADTPLAFAAMALLSAMSIVLFYLVVALERLLLPWARPKP
jgi:NitT/TauT family transport system permease protein